MIFVKTRGLLYKEKVISCLEESEKLSKQGWWQRLAEPGLELTKQSIVNNDVLYLWEAEKRFFEL